MADNWYQGNAAAENDQHRGWLLGHFIDGEDATIRKTNALEVKWGIHKAGEERPEWTTGEDRTTLFMLISGKWRLDLTVGTFTLDRPGDYIVWGPGIDHSWQAQADSTVLTIRWPSSQL